MKKSDLKTGMVVENRNGERYMVIVGNFQTTICDKQDVAFVGGNGFDIASNYDDELGCVEFKELDIVKIYRPRVRPFGHMLWDRDAKLLWERKDKKQPTPRDIEVMRAMYFVFGHSFFACDKNGEQFGYDQKPKKGYANVWGVGDYGTTTISVPSNRRLSHISWEDDEPYEFNPDI